MKGFSALLAAMLFSGTASAMTEVEAEARIREAFQWGFPAQQMDAFAGQQALLRARTGTPVLNTWNHSRKLVTAADRFITTPNSDTLYSIALVDLSQGPVVLGIPELDSRYYSVALVDMYTNNVAIIASRTHGTRAQEIVLTGPGSRTPLPDNRQVVQLPQNRIVVLLRVLVQDESDVKTVNALQDRFRLAPIAAPVAAADGAGAFAGKPGEAQDPEAFLAAVNRVVDASPPPAYETEKLSRLAPVGVCGSKCGWDKLSPEVRKTWQRLYADLQASVRVRALPGAASRNGWSGQKPTLGDFGTDYDYRAKIARQGLLALKPEEAIYYSTAMDIGGAQLDGASRYTFTIPPGGLPVNAFWSLTLYETASDGRLFFYDNPANRYLIGDRTPTLQKDADGKIVIAIQHEQPAAAGNWLPAPKGRFVLVLRAYAPKTSMLDNSFVVPGIVRVQ
jgi:hypothetical protein